MRILVTGAGGMLAADLIPAARRAGHDVVGLGSAELDVTDAAATRSGVAAVAPQAIVNCAAYTDVDGAEARPELAEAVNATGAGHVAAAAAAAGARLVHLSSDYVFDGRAREPYVESDPPAPLSVYGQTKRAGELAVLGAAPRAIVVRSAWLFGVGGGNFVATMLALARDHDRLRVVADQVGSPTWTGHLAPALVELAASGAPGIHHVASAGACSWHELCIATLRTARLDVSVDALSTQEFPRPAPRPAYSALASERTDTPRLASWRDGLAGYLAARAAPAAEKAR